MNKEVFIEHFTKEVMEDNAAILLGQDYPYLRVLLIGQVY